MIERGSVMTRDFTKAAAVLIGVAAIAAVAARRADGAVPHHYGGTMNDKSNEEMFSEHLVKIILAGNLVTQSWLKFLVTIQGGLALGFVFVLRPTEPAVPPWLILPMCFLIPSVAVLSAIAVSAFVIRHQQWQAWNVRAYNRISGNTGKVFPYDGKLPTSMIWKMPIGFVAKLVLGLMFLLIVVWVVAAVYAFRGTA
jgi:hypothetical protein